MNNRHLVAKVSGFCLSSLVAIASIASAEDFEAHNEYDQNFYLWIYPSTKGQWENKKPFIKRKAFEIVSVDNADKYYLMLKDEKGRERHLGWFPIPEVFRNSTPKQLVFGITRVQQTQDYTVSVPVTTMMEQSYTVNVPRTETRTVIRNGVPVFEKVTVYDQVTQTRTVPQTTMTTETRQRIVVQETPYVKVSINGEWQPVQGELREKRKIGVTFHICPDGVHVDTVDSGSAAENMWDINGNVFKLEPGDHILLINGQAPKQSDELIKIVSEARGPLPIVVLDNDGVTRRELQIEPR
jgi:hypothetical protein